jgi:hypothetical protein
MAARSDVHRAPYRSGWEQSRPDLCFMTASLHGRRRRCASIAHIVACFPLDAGSADRASSVLSLCNRRERSSECFGGDHHLVNVIALRALKGAEVVPNSCGHNASEHHASMAHWAGGTLDSSIDMVRQKIGFLHDASLEQAGARHSLSPVTCPR